MRIALVDLNGTEGLVTKDTVAGGYGSRLRPFSKVTSIVSHVKSWMHRLPSVQLGYLAAIAASDGHAVTWTSEPAVPAADVIVILSSLVDYRNETALADRLRAEGRCVGFVGLAASMLPELFLPHADFVIKGEPEAAARQLAGGERLTGLVRSPEPSNLDALPYPRWDLAPARRSRVTIPFAGRPLGGAFPLMASRSCPEFCTYCPHRIQSSYRARSVGSILDELRWLVSISPRPHVVFRDPLFTEHRDRTRELCARIREVGLDLTFECETRLDRLDEPLLEELHAAGLRAMSFGVESVSPETLHKSGRRPIPEAHQRAMVEHCRRLGVVTAGFFVLGFLQDTWESTSATIEYAVDLGPTVAQFKVLTPYPGTPMWKQLSPRIVDADWEHFDGFTPVFAHPSMTANELRFLLGAAYTRFYMRPSYLANYLRLRATPLRRGVSWLDAVVRARQTRDERQQIRRAVTC